MTIVEATRSGGFFAVARSASMQPNGSSGRGLGSSGGRIRRAHTSGWALKSSAWIAHKTSLAWS